MNPSKIVLTTTLRSRGRWALLGILASASLGCQHADGAPDPVVPSDTWSAQSSVASSPAQPTTPAAPAPSTPPVLSLPPAPAAPSTYSAAPSDSSTESLVPRILAAPRPLSPSPSPDNYSKLVELIKAEGPSLSEGGAIAVRYLNVSKNLRASEGFIVQGIEKNNGTTLILARGPQSSPGWFAIVVRQPLRPGHFECDEKLVLANADTVRFKPDDPSTSWTINPGGSCEMDIYAGAGKGDLQGKFSAKLVTNQGASYHYIEAGYFYIKSPRPSANVAPPEAMVSLPR